MRDGAPWIHTVQLGYFPGALVVLDPRHLARQIQMAWGAESHELVERCLADAVARRFPGPGRRLRVRWDRSGSGGSRAGICWAIWRRMRRGITNLARLEATGSGAMEKTVDVPSHTSVQETRDELGTIRVRSCAQAAAAEGEWGVGELLGRSPTGFCSQSSLITDFGMHRTIWRALTASVTHGTQDVCYGARVLEYEPSRLRHTSCNRSAFHPATASVRGGGSRSLRVPVP